MDTLVEAEVLVTSGIVGSTDFLESVSCGFMFDGDTMFDETPFALGCLLS